MRISGEQVSVNHCGCGCSSSVGTRRDSGRTGQKGRRERSFCPVPGGCLRDHDQGAVMVEWRDPPDLRHRPGVWIDRLSPVMKRPGKWAMFWTCSTVEEAGVLSRQLRNRKRA